MTNQSILTRYAAVVPVLVDAGCEAPPIDIRRYPFEPSTRIAVLEQWFQQTVVPWVHATFEWHFEQPRYSEGFKHWYWLVGTPFESFDPDPTEANIQCLESLVEVIGGKR